MGTITPRRFLRGSKEQAEYLTNLGLPISGAALDCLASRGTGPKFFYFRKWRCSTPEWLDEWVKENSSAGARSVSDLREAS